MPCFNSSALAIGESRTNLSLPASIVKPAALNLFIISLNNLSIFPKLPNSLKYLCCGNNPWIEPIPIEYYNLANDKKDIYDEEQKLKFGSYEFQKEFIEKYPFRLKDLEPIGIDLKIRDEYAYLFDFDQYLD